MNEWYCVYCKFSVNSWLHARFKNTNQNWEQRGVKIGLVSARDGIQAQSLHIVWRFPASCVTQGEVESGLPGHHKCQKGRIILWISPSNVRWLGFWVWIWHCRVKERTCSIWPTSLFCCPIFIKVLKRDAKTVGERRRPLVGNHLYRVHQFDVSTIIWPITKKYKIVHWDKRIRTSYLDRPETYVFVKACVFILRKHRNRAHILAWLRKERLNRFSFGSET